MRSTFVRTAAIAALLALAGASAAMAPAGVDTLATPTGPGGATYPAALGPPDALTAADPLPALTCPGEVLWPSAPRTRSVRPNRRPPPPPPVPRGPTGRIEGRVTDGTSGQLLHEAAITVVGINLSTLTNQAGNYSLLNVPVGENTVKVELLGYEAQERQVTVAEGRATVADFALEVDAVGLDQRAAASVAVVERKKLGDALPSVDAAQLRKVIPLAGSARVLHHRVPDPNTESYARIVENDFRLVSASPLSTFAIDVDRASYANVRRFIQDGRRPPVDAVRIEEMINYFPYEWDEAGGEHPFAVTTEVTDAPWKREHRLVRIGLHAPSVDMRDLPPRNLVFLLDVSGSMDEPNKLPLLQSAFSLLADRLRPEDHVTVMTYSNVVCLALPSTSGDLKHEILATIERLSAGGGTAGGPALQHAYEIAREHHVEGGNNRIVLATDGDFNVGPSSDEAMVELVERERAAGTHLTVLGFGTGNLKDSKMEQIADNGNGNFHYVDGLLEARKVLIEEAGGTLVTVAKDVKLQVEFNPSRVAGYRLLGYENRLLADEDFNDDTKDAGELGAGHTVTALYEVVPAGTGVPRAVDALRYQPEPDDPPLSEFDDEMLYVKVRYKDRDGTKSRLLEHAVADRGGTGSTDFRFAAAVAGFGMLLRDSEHAGAFTLDDVVRLAEKGKGEDPRGYRGEFIRLVEATRDLGLLRRETDGLR
ncbi:MAG: von Willebrand factor type A domain-containing protein [Gemmatimonadota bacterium]|nr:von Willebrand factor type A domain-containing protein [Gemmatimonadota bacterium]MDE2873420.1 von Willebrand factor type A domain-containing protein [Gemmatimonadota bacterium]